MAPYDYGCVRQHACRQLAEHYSCKRGSSRRNALCGFFSRADKFAAARDLALEIVQEALMTSRITLLRAH